MAGKLVTVYWRDIPAQVVARVGRGGAKVQLADRFTTTTTTLIVDSL